MAFAASESRDDTDKKYEDDNAALNATGQAPSSTLVVPEFSASFLSCKEVVVFSIVIWKAVKQLTCKEACCCKLSNISADGHGINAICKNDIVRSLQFIGRINRGLKLWFGYHVCSAPTSSVIRYDFLCSQI